MQTVLKYLSNSSLTEHAAVCLNVTEDEVILNETIFYPQGGGQPCDTGFITNNEAKFCVNKVFRDENGIVHHLGHFISNRFSQNEKVHLSIDVERRKLNSRLHSAGHLIDCAVEKLQLNNLIPTKGYHFPDGPSVEYQGVIDNKEELLPQLQKIIDELVSQNLLMEIRDISSTRMVNFQGFKSCGCGGTHVTSSGEIGKITIRKIKCKKGITKISYSCAVNV